MFSRHEYQGCEREESTVASHPSSASLIKQSEVTMPSCPADSCYDITNFLVHFTKYLVGSMMPIGLQKPYPPLACRSCPPKTPSQTVRPALGPLSLQPTPNIPTQASSPCCWHQHFTLYSLTLTVSSSAVMFLRYGFSYLRSTQGQSHTLPMF